MNGFIEVIKVENTERLYSSKEVAQRLSIEAVTVRKYSQMLEKQECFFQKDDKNWRQYTENDIYFLRHVRDAKDFGKSLEESINYVAHLYRKHQEISQLDATTKGPQEELHGIQEELCNFQKELRSFINSQQEFNQQLLKMLEIQDRQKERDRSLVFAINQSLETRKKVAAMKQKKWWQFWKDNY